MCGQGGEVCFHPWRHGCLSQDLETKKVSARATERREHVYQGPQVYGSQTARSAGGLGGRCESVAEARSQIRQPQILVECLLSLGLIVPSFSSICACSPVFVMEYEHPRHIFSVQNSGTEVSDHT